MVQNRVPISVSSSAYDAHNAPLALFSLFCLFINTSFINTFLLIPVIISIFIVPRFQHFYIPSLDLLFLFGQWGKHLIEVAEPTRDTETTFNAVATRGTDSLPCSKPQLQGHCDVSVYMVQMS